MKTTISDNCCRCKKCERICPVSAIDIDQKNINDDCIKCYHCTAICQYKAINSSYITGEVTQNNISPNDFELLMQQRRTHRNFSSRKVAPELLSEFINHLRFSPTASNLQTLNFTIVTNADKIQQVNKLTIDTLTGAYNTLNILTKPLIRMLLGQHRLQQMEQSKRKFLSKKAINKQMITYNAPALIIVHSTTSPVGMPCYDASIWTGMAILYAELLDLCTCINGYVVNASKRNNKIKRLLNISKPETIYAALLIGYPQSKFENTPERSLPYINTIE